MTLNKSFFVLIAHHFAEIGLCQTTTYNSTSFGDVTFDSVLQNEVSSSDVICEDGGFFGKQ